MGPVSLKGSHVHWKCQVSTLQAACWTWTEPGLNFTFTTMTEKNFPLQQTNVKRAF